MTKSIVVRWRDAYLEEFDAIDVRFGSDVLWIKLTNGDNRHIPLRAVRWFSINNKQGGEY